MRNREDFKVFKDVFDRQTHFALNKLMNRRVFEHLGGEISIGKEANVFYCEDEEGTPLVLKIYRIATADFRNIRPYLAGDPRFSDPTSKRKFIYSWTTKEYRNLLRMHKNNLPVPKPIDYMNNVLAMEFLGTDTRPMPQIRYIKDADWEHVSDRLIQFMVDLYQKAGLVHADLSEYNILFDGKDPFIIDCGQSVSLNFPQVDVLLERDVSNVLRFLSNRGVKNLSKEIIIEKIKGNENV